MTTCCFFRASSSAGPLALLSIPSTTRAQAPSCQGERMSTISCC
ncbi:KLK10 isoform 4 [Pan troglodytes]|uniref:KLK10 isoform 4 n=1 Tax=Pan troglodytes TaxID=9598 RepID=A0A2J8Q6K8_PANTR|nr:KLK10 isoform 4 [Pan troglodytes]